MPAHTIQTRVAWTTASPENRASLQFVLPQAVLQLEVGTDDDRMARQLEIDADLSDAERSMLLRVADAGKTQAAMKARGVLVKNVSALHPLLANCLRLTVGSAEENTQMLAVLQESL